jgi:hypothetical protein
LHQYDAESFGILRKLLAGFVRICIFATVRDTYNETVRPFEQNGMRS